MVVQEKAYAKVNLYLDVTGRRSDGFHEIFSIMHSVSLCDHITVTASLSDETSIDILTDDPNLETNRSNIAYRSAAEFLSYFKIDAKIIIEIKKNIPIGAGLGGGSSDGAATIRALNKIFKLGSWADLLAIAEKVGSDLPFCLFGGICLCTGRGEKIQAIDCSPTYNLVIAIGKDRVSTPAAYAELDKIYNGYVDYQLSDELIEHQQIIYKLLNNQCTYVPFYNAFEKVAIFSEISSIKEIMRKNRAECTLMSGSGPAVFGIFDTRYDAEDAYKNLVEEGFSAYICTSVYPEVKYDL